MAYVGDGCIRHAAREAPGVHGLRLVFYGAIQLSIVQASRAKNLDGTHFYAHMIMSSSYSLTSSAVGRSIAR